MKHVAGVGKIRKEGVPGQSTTRLLTRAQGVTSKAAQHDAELGSREPKEGARSVSVCSRRDGPLPEIQVDKGGLFPGP